MGKTKVLRQGLDNPGNLCKTLLMKRCNAHNMAGCLYCTQSRNLAWVAAVEEQKRSNATRPHRSKKVYNRKRKHKGNDYA